MKTKLIALIALVLAAFGGTATIATGITHAPQVGLTGNRIAPPFTS